MTTMPIEFRAQMQQLLGDEWGAFTDALQQPAPISIRYNPFKNNGPSTTLEKVSWSPSAYYLPERPIFTLDPAFQAGAYYVQEASSMFVGEVVRQLFPTKRPKKVLDLCAAPGGKTTDLLSCLPSESLLVCNEVIRSRFQILKQNIIKWGQANVVVSNHDSKDFARLNGFFDLVLVDAPCSGEGLFRKDPKASSEWSPDNVQLCTGRQKRILANATELLAPEGILIFSTCTYNKQENEANAEWMINNFGLEAVSLNVPEDWNITQREIGYQFYPHKIKGEGFYIAVMKKKDGPSNEMRIKSNSLSKPSKHRVQILNPWVTANNEKDILRFFEHPEQNEICILPNGIEQEVAHVIKALPKSLIGTNIGQFKRDDFIPSHGLALSNYIGKTVPFITLSKQEALKYLKKENFQPSDSVPQGWFLVKYEGHTLGWAKGLKNRINNYYPKNWRIRMQVK